MYQIQVSPFDKSKRGQNRILGLVLNKYKNISSIYLSFFNNKIKCFFERGEFSIPEPLSLSS